MSEKFKAVVIDNQNEKFTREIKEINKFLETCIRKKPEDWFWIHNRWDKRFNLD